MKNTYSQAAWKHLSVKWKCYWSQKAPISLLFLSLHCLQQFLGNCFQSRQTGPKRLQWLHPSGVDIQLCPTSCLLRNRPQFGALPGDRLLCNQRAVVLNKHYTGNVQSLPSSSLGPWGGSLSGRVSSTRNALICAVSVYGGMVQPSPCSSTATLASSAQVAAKCGLPLGVSKPMGRDTYWVNCPHDISFSSKHMMIDSVSCSLMSHPLWPHEL